MNATSGLRSIAAIARADFLERIRRYSFLMALLFAVFLGYATATGKIFLQFDEYRGVYTSAWIGTLVAMVITCFLSLVGFYIVKNSVDRDRATGVGQILAATPLSKTSYAFGKFLSNFAVLSSMVAVLAIAALVMQFWIAEDRNIDLWALLSPFLLLALPAIALSAVSALLFEMVPLLRGGLGNIAWFFVWIFGLAAPLLSGRRWLDPMGLVAVMDSLGAQARRYVPGYHGGMSFQIDIGQHLQVVQAWRWPGIAWSFQSILLRVMWFAVACAIVPLAALFFDRFDSAKAAKSKNGSKKKLVAPALQPPAAAHASYPAAVVHLTPLVASARANGFGRLVIAELRLALRGYRWWWYAVALGLLVAQLATPLMASYGPILAAAWLWPVLVWSAMGARESRFATSALLFSCARILPRQLPACFLAGFLVTAFTGAGAAIRLLLAGQTQSVIAWLVAAAFLPALALALGVLTGSSKFFEGLYVTWWYVGPLNHTPGLDFTGSASGPAALRYAMIYLALAAALAFAAFAARARQLRLA
jgi:hypothetical protein